MVWSNYVLTFGNETGWTHYFHYYYCILTYILYTKKFSRNYVADVTEWSNVLYVQLCEL